MSTFAVIVLIVVAALLLAMLAAGARKATQTRPRHNLGPAPGEGDDYRSHAEASRHSSGRT